MPFSAVRLLATLGLMLSAACIGDKETKVIKETFEAVEKRPDTLPLMLNKRPPFQYPAGLLSRKIQANVTLRIHIDSVGHVVPESTTVFETSKIPELDSAALRGSKDLRFVPAKKHGKPIAVSLLFPVYFRAPGEPPLPGDTILRTVRPPS